MAAGLATLAVIDATSDLYEVLEARGAQLAAGLAEAAVAAGVPVVINRVGSMLTVFFTDQPVTDYTSALSSDTARFARFFHGLLARGVYWPPSAFEAAFLSYAHSVADIETVVAAARAAFGDL
jgi:glutamate-1-semialdehyde 2,1-aminomutase